MLYQTRQGDRIHVGSLGFIFLKTNAGAPGWQSQSNPRTLDFLSGRDLRVTSGSVLSMESP